MSEYAYRLPRHRCAECKKLIYMLGTSEEWAYKLRWKGRNKYYCSWTCFRKNQMKWEKQKRENQQHGGYVRAQKRLGVVE